MGAYIESGKRMKWTLNLASEAAPSFNLLDKDSIKTAQMEGIESSIRQGIRAFRQATGADPTDILMDGSFVSLVRDKQERGWRYTTEQLRVS